MNYRRLLTFAIAFSLQVCGLILAQDTHQQDTHQVEQLALRLLGGVDRPESTTDLMIKQVPQDLPFDLRLPEDAQLLGSYVRRDENKSLQAVQIVLDVPLSIQASLAFFDSSLKDQGWITQLEPLAVGLVTEPNLYTAMYCSPDGLSFTYVTAFLIDAEHADVNFDLYQDSSYPGCAEDHEIAGDSLENAPLPMLNPPEDADIETLNKLLIVEPLSVSILLTTSLKQADILQHYQRQLEAANWQNISSGESGDLSFGRWAFTDPTNLVWTTILTVMDLGEPNEYYVSLVVLLPFDASEVD